MYERKTGVPWEKLSDNLTFPHTTLQIGSLGRFGEKQVLYHCGTHLPDHFGELNIYYIHKYNIVCEQLLTGSDCPYFVSAAKFIT